MEAYDPTFLPSIRWDLNRYPNPSGSSKCCYTVLCGKNLIKYLVRMRFKDTYLPHKQKAYYSFLGVVVVLIMDRPRDTPEPV